MLYGWHEKTGRYPWCGLGWGLVAVAKAWMVLFCSSMFALVDGSRGCYKKQLLLAVHVYTTKREKIFL